MKRRRPFPKVGTRVRVVGAVDTEIHDVSSLIGRIGRIVGFRRGEPAPWLVRFSRPVLPPSSQRRAVYVEAFWWVELRRLDASM